MKTIGLNKGYQTVVDDEDYDFLSQFTWHIHGPKEHPYVRSSYKMLMHKMILGCADSYEIDHIDGDSLNNQRSNLRVCTRQQNNSNRNKYKIGHSKYKGVTKRLTGQWRARIRVDYKLISLGDYDTEICAAKAYDEAATKHFGIFAKLNFQEK